jgi:Cu+-exporting ATPase
VQPEHKVRIVKACKNNNYITAMTGDGVNDAPALTVAKVGVAIGAGTDIAIESADVVLIKNDLNDVANCIVLGKKVMKNIKENLFWAFFYNILLIPIASGVLSSVGITLNPMIAAGAMSLSSLFVVGNALRLRVLKFNNNLKGEKNMLFKKKEGKTMVIEGMMCQHCQSRVEKVFKNFGIDVEINLKKKTAFFPLTEVDDEQIKKAVEAEGYKVVSIE